MYCPKCKKKVDYNLESCPYCYHNLSFKTNDTGSEVVEKISDGVENIGKISEGYNKAVVIAVLITMLILIGVIYSFSKMPYINGMLGLIFNGSKILKIVGLAGFGISLVWYFINRKSNSIKKLLLIFAVCVGISFILPNMITINGNISLTNFTKVEYIEFDEFKIPTMYSVVGKRDIVMSFEEDQYYDEEMKINYDLVSIVYKNLSEEDRNAYQNELLANGFTTVTFYNGEENITVFAKNNDDNTFLTVSIEDLALSYTHIKGKYEDVLLGGM